MKEKVRKMIKMKNNGNISNFVMVEKIMLKKSGRCRGNLMKAKRARFLS